MSFEERCKHYGVKPEDVRAWVKKTYPQFAGMEGVGLQLYLKQVKNASVAGSDLAPMKGKEVAISDLVVGEWCIITGVVGIKEKDNTYVGCPNCFKKLEGEYCQKCGTQVEPTTHHFTSYLVSDPSGDVMVDFPPRISNIYADLEGKALRIQGSLGEQGTFMAQRISFIGESEILPPIAKKQAEVQATNVVDKFKEIMSQFPDTSVGEMKRWHKESQVNMPFELLVKTAGYVIDGDKLVPAGSGESETQGAEADDEAGQLASVLSAMPEVPYTNLEKWHKSRGLKTPLDELIRLAGAETVGEGADKKVVPRDA